MTTSQPGATTTVAKQTMLSRQEEADLARRSEAGLAAEAALAGAITAPADATVGELVRLAEQGRQAFFDLVERNLALVGFVVAPIARATGLDREELIQEGRVGLVEAAQRFDPSRGSFASCAIPWIRMRAWDEAVTAHGSLGIPPRRARQWRRAVAMRDALAGDLARAPKVEEVAAQVGESVTVVRSLLRFRPACRLTPEHECAVPAAAPDDADAPDVSAMLAGLSPLHRRILILRHGLAGTPAHSTSEIAAALRCSASTVRRYEQAALEAVRGVSAIAHVA